MTASTWSYWLLAFRTAWAARASPSFPRQIKPTSGRFILTQLCARLCHTLGLVPKPVKIKHSPFKWLLLIIMNTCWGIERPDKLVGRSLVVDDSWKKEEHLLLLCRCVPPGWRGFPAEPFQFWPLTVLNYSSLFSYEWDYKQPLRATDWSRRANFGMLTPISDCWGWMEMVSWTSRVSLSAGMNMEIKDVMEASVEIWQTINRGSSSSQQWASIHPFSNSCSSSKHSMVLEAIRQMYSAFNTPFSSWNNRSIHQTTIQRRTRRIEEGHRSSEGHARSINVGINRMEFDEIGNIGRHMLRPDVKFRIATLTKPVEFEPKTGTNFESFSPLWNVPQFNEAAGRGGAKKIGWDGKQSRETFDIHKG